ncbi:hypothetical protein FACS1894105_04330 [Clostridia bacterium]|nr:hypothetical protein FACS1894105_04330 [Clostridia bacterium]
MRYYISEIIKLLKSYDDEDCVYLENGNALHFTDFKDGVICKLHLKLEIEIKEGWLRCIAKCPELDDINSFHCTRCSQEHIYDMEERYPEGCPAGNMPIWE